MRICQSMCTMLSTHCWIITIIGKAIKQGLSNDWLINWIKPIFKARDKNKVSNYLTIKIQSSTIAKLYRTIMEQKPSSLAKRKNKRALGQVGFRPKPSGW